MIKEDKRRLFHTLFFPTLFVFVLWLVKITEIVFHTDFSSYGINPRSISGIKGIFLSPLIHGDFNHLFSNTIPLLVLGYGLFYFYRPVGYKVFFLIYFITGLWVWVFARPAFHIGASGIVYGLASFLFFSGLIRGNKYLMAFSLLVVFLYGSLFWGIFPLYLHVSWESHLMGAVAGILCAFYFRSYGLQREKYQWEDEEEQDENPDIDPENKNDQIFKAEQPQISSPRIRYIYKENRGNEI